MTLFYILGVGLPIILIVLPMTVFLCIKLGTYGYLVARHKFSQRHCLTPRQVPELKNDNTTTQSGGSLNGYAS